MELNVVITSFVSQ